MRIRKLWGLKFILIGLIGLSTLAGPPFLRASAIDVMNTTAGFFSFAVVQTPVGPGQNVVNPPGYLPPTAAANGNGTVTLAVQDSHADTTEGILDWTMPGGLSNPYMNLVNNRFLQLNLTSVSPGSNYDVNFLFWGPSPTPAFLSEVPWLVNAGPNDLHPDIDVSSLAPGGTDQFFVRFRLLPPNVPGDVLTLDSITTAPSSAVPEPGSVLLAVMGLFAVAGRLVKRRAVGRSAAVNRFRRGRDATPKPSNRMWRTLERSRLPSPSFGAGHPERSQPENGM